MLATRPGKHTYIAIEHGPIEIVDLPIKPIGSFHSYVNVYLRLTIFQVLSGTSLLSSSPSNWDVDSWPIITTRVTLVTFCMCSQRAKTHKHGCAYHQWIYVSFFFPNMFKLHVSTNVAVRLGSSNVRQTDIVGMYNKAHVFSLMYLFSFFFLPYICTCTHRAIYIYIRICLCMRIGTSNLI